jgi:hypothetical protein
VIGGAVAAGAVAVGYYVIAGGCIGSMGLACPLAVAGGGYIAGAGIAFGVSYYMYLWDNRKDFFNFNGCTDWGVCRGHF